MGRRAYQQAGRELREDMKQVAQTLLRWETDVDGILIELKAGNIQNAVALLKRLRKEIMEKHREQA